MTQAVRTSLTDLNQVDRRTRAWRRRERRRAELVTSLGGVARISPHQSELVELLLATGAMLENFQARLAAGEDVDTERFMSVSKEHRRLLGELGLSRQAASDKPAPGQAFTEHLAGIAARKRADATVTK